MILCNSFCCLFVCLCDCLFVHCCCSDYCSAPVACCFFPFSSSSCCSSSCDYWLIFFLLLCLFFFVLFCFCLCSHSLRCERELTRLLARSCSSCVVPIWLPTIILWDSELCCLLFAPLRLCLLPKCVCPFLFFSKVVAFRPPALG